MKSFKINTILNINELFNTIDLNKCRVSYLLNTEQDNFDIIEKIVYDLAMIYFKNNDLIYDKNKYFIEFWYKYNAGWNIHNYLHPMHYDKDEEMLRNNNKIIHPLIATVTYLSNNNCPTIILNVTNNEEKNNIFQKSPELILSFPINLKHIQFNGTYKHGAINIFNNEISINDTRNALMFNIWDNKPLNANYYESIKNKIYKKNDHFFNLEKIDNTIYSNTTLTNEIIKEIIYKKKNIKTIINDLFKDNNINTEDLNTIIIN